MIAVDTNILIYAHRGETELHDSAAAQLVTLAEGMERWALPVFCVTEFMRVVEAVRIGGGFDMEKILRAASDIGGYAPEMNPRYEPDGRKEASEDIERFEWVARWLGLKEPEGEILFNPGGQSYMSSDITREHLLGVLEAICEGEPVDRDIWARNDPERAR